RVQAREGTDFRAGSHPLRLAHHQGRGQARAPGASFRSGARPVGNASGAQIASRADHEASGGCQGRASRTAGGPAGPTRQAIVFSMPPVSPLAPTRIPSLPEVAGVRLAAGAAGLRYIGRTDVLLAVLDKGTTAAGVLTQSRCPSAPVEWCRARLAAGTARGIVVNSGNANAFTGKSGREAVKTTAEIAAQAS